MTTLVTLLVVLVVICLLFFVIQQIPGPPNIKIIMNIVVALIAIFLLLDYAGIIHLR